MLSVSGTSEIDGRCLVEFVCQRDRLTYRPPHRASFDHSDRGLREMTKHYKLANDDRWATQTARVDGGTFRTTLIVPPAARGPCYVRVFVQGDDDVGVGAADVYVNLKSRSTKKPSLP
jgi:hypothetical protein